jgi:hypothetical protein
VAQWHSGMAKNGKVAKWHGGKAYKMTGLHKIAVKI